MKWLKNAKEQIKQHEGFRLKAYRDSLDYWTIGYGHLLNKGDYPMIETIDKEEAQKLFETDFEVALTDAKKIFSDVWDNLSDKRKIALIDMSFNLGAAKLSAFKRMIAAVERGDFERAANEALASKWAKQVGKRAITIAEQLRKG
jgi:lysozyme